MRASRMALQRGCWLGSLCLKAAGAAQGLPMVVLPMVVVFPAVRLVNPALAASFGADPGGLSRSARDP